ncbi:hypothetical protein Ddye_002405 [Dipteronia dyeriana]|uniref:Uncharacterized protein n=1 Tax=Dipteronia dyeriana TaxID=168575 RepID=A0AAD9XQW0_9ROSI|nr:hypothetical protein Ddye_002405 [Dipteronia dyeriana]
MVRMRRFPLSLMGKVLTNRLVNRELFLGLIESIWKVEERVEIEVVTNNIFTFLFNSLEDHVYVLAYGSWTGDDALILLEKPLGKGDIKSMNFRYSKFRVQIHSVPLLCITKEIRRFLGVMVGMVTNVDAGSSRECSGKFLMVYVKMDVDQPFQRCLDYTLKTFGEILKGGLRWKRVVREDGQDGQDGTDLGNVVSLGK